ncbi:NAD-dependent protein deacylase [Enterococcus raffinosus]|uniref:protein acetyllysine N-acetyltransferase n=1 Tax=Enterococcus raffinosus TaxID=71452 RepID=A0AAW8T2R2_9ENTE|nr:NAD-dependent protein deacylase [Enterococcus raffinosus]MDT2522308.1 NAD-dependent protein deacylase [Enterococcus raffinosus]MDT2530882.1 NAD-dependent protein deacylase [Enterococcus raffinosus]MDT2533495.1 NAD-dependent protein deacylase [Enterococcus raffinosus]MDT2543385.1 NAD-dependent protein deacylase [Enterococcus raffinosus]MDT2554151.1 NAD-dependent protein deacylase [Enterococcus raffinosus]
MEITVDQAVEMIQQSKSITFLTGAGVSTPSGVPDYRSLQGVYHGLEVPEYLLRNACLVHEPEKFYQFVKHLYHEEAQPNSIHLAMAEMEKTKKIWVVSQNIDGLHAAAGSRHLVNFHGSLYDCYCRNCGEVVPWEEYLQSDRHRVCGGQIRPNIVLYGEGFEEKVIQQAIQAVGNAELVVIVGTSFQVHPFCDLIYEKQQSANVLVINQTPIQLAGEYNFVQTNGVAVFSKL